MMSQIKEVSFPLALVWYRGDRWAVFPSPGLAPAASQASRGTQNLLRLLWNSFLIAFSALLPLINPLGSALVFLGLVGEAPPAVYRSLARRIALNNIAFLAVIEVLGSAILNFFGVSLAIVQVSGGIVIASLGWSVLNEKDSSAGARGKQEEMALKADSPAGHTAESPAAAAPGTGPETSLHFLEQKAFYPFTFPVTSGPGTLVVMLTLSARYSGGPMAQNVVGHLGLFLAVIVLSALVYLCFAYAPRITRAIPASTAHGILRVVAFILLCIGVQIAWNGLSQLLGGLLRP